MEQASYHRRKMGWKYLILLIAICLIAFPQSVSTSLARAEVANPPAQATFTAHILTDNQPLPLQLQVPASANVGDRVTFTLMGNENELSFSETCE